MFNIIFKFDYNNYHCIKFIRLWFSGIFYFFLILDRKGRVLKKENKNKKKIKKILVFLYEDRMEKYIKKFFKDFLREDQWFIKNYDNYYISRKYSFYALVAS